MKLIIYNLTPSRPWLQDARCCCVEVMEWARQKYFEDEGSPTCDKDDESPIFFWYIAARYGSVELVEWAHQQGHSDVWSDLDGCDDDDAGLPPTKAFAFPCAAIIMALPAYAFTMLFLFLR